MADADRHARAFPWLVLAPAAVGAALAGAWLLAGPAGRVRFEVEPAPLALGVGLALTLLLVGLRTQRLRRERAVAAAAAHATEAARRDHLRFLRRLDHELKNPLTAIRAAVAGGAADPGQLRTADAQAARLAGVVTDLRKLADLRTSDLEMTVVDLGVLVEDVVDVAREELRAAGRAGDLRVDLPRAPWGLPSMTGDPDLLWLALHNVVSNAAKFSRRGEAIEVRASERDGWVEIDVADTGRGIAAGEVDQVWEELSRGSNAREVPGSGLGLPMVRAVVERHGGEVSIRSREGAGTGVLLRLPTVRG